MTALTRMRWALAAAVQVDLHEGGAHSTVQPEHRRTCREQVVRKLHVTEDQHLGALLTIPPLALLNGSSRCVTAQRRARGGRPSCHGQ
jgi:hypothetical protein